MKRNIVRIAIVLAIGAGGWVAYGQVSGWLAADETVVTDVADDSAINIPDTLESPATKPAPADESSSSRYTTASEAIERGQDPAGDQPASFDEPDEPRSFEPTPAANSTPRDAQFFAREANRLVGTTTNTDEGTSANVTLDRYDVGQPRSANYEPIANQDDEDSVVRASASEAASRGRYQAKPSSDVSADTMPPADDNEPHDARKTAAIPPADSIERNGSENVETPQEFTPPAENIVPAAAATRDTQMANEPTPANASPAVADNRYGVTPNPYANADAAVADTASPTTGAVVPIERGDALGSTDGTGRPGSKRLEGPQTPQLAIQKFAPSEIQVGRECVFEIKVRNTGEYAAQNVQIHDEIPEGTRLVSTTPDAVRSPDGRVAWELGALGPGDQASVEMRLMPTDEGEIGSVATLKFESSASVRTKSTRPELAIRLTPASDEVMIGDEITVKVEVSNPGTGDATGVMLLENVPDKVTHPAGQSLEFEIGTLAVGETRELDLVLTAAQAGKVVNTLTARGDASLRVEAAAEFEVIAPELEVSVSGPKRRFLDRQATYEVAVSNPGTAAARDVELVTRLPEGMKFVKANNSGHYDAATHAVYWSLEELPPSQHGTVELVALPTAPGNQTLKVEGTAQQGLKHTAQQQLTVEGIAAIMFEVVDLNDPIVVGEETTYEIRVVNQGSKEATNVAIQALFPAGMEPTSAAGPSGHKISTDRVTFEPLRQLAPKADTAFRIQAKGTSDGDRRIHVQLVTGEVQKPVTKEVSTRVYKDE